VCIPTGDFSKSRGAVEAFDGERVRHSIARENIAYVVLQKYATQAGKFIESDNGPLDHAVALVKFVKERGTADVDVDRVHKADAQFRHVLRARQHDSVVAAWPGMEERH